MSSADHSDKPSGKKEGKLSKKKIALIVGIGFIVLAGLAFIQVRYLHQGVDTLVQPSETEKLIYPAPNMTSHQIHCEYLFETISNKAQLNDSLNAEGNKMLRVIYVMSKLLDQQVNGTQDQMLTEFKMNCLNDTGGMP